jgi:D-proline reductase (dithiol) PrdB
MTVEYIKRIRDKYAAQGYAPYQWTVHEDPPPWQPLDKPLSECRIGLIASGGVYLLGQVAFHYKDDTSFRMIPRDTKLEDLRATHFAYDLSGVRQDPNVVFPLGTLRTLVRDGIVGELAAHAYTFMGGIYSTRRVREELAPALTEQLLAEHVDAVLLVPV